MPTLPAQNPPTADRSLWQRRLRDPIVAQLTQGITPEKIALTVAVGSALGLFPILGTTTLLCLVIGLALRLNQPIIQLINQALWPVHIPAIIACVRLGETLFGVRHEHLSIKAMRTELWDQPSLFLQHFGAAVLHAVVAWALVAPFYIAFIYYISLPLLRSIARLKAEASAHSAPPPDHPVP